MGGGDAAPARRDELAKGYDPRSAEDRLRRFNHQLDLQDARPQAESTLERSARARERRDLSRGDDLGKRDHEASGHLLMRFVRQGGDEPVERAQAAAVEL